MGNELTMNAYGWAPDAWTVFASNALDEATAQENKKGDYSLVAIVALDSLLLTNRPYNLFIIKKHIEKTFLHKLRIKKFFDAHFAPSPMQNKLAQSYMIQRITSYYVFQN